jgi:hypothetical protein
MAIASAIAGTSFTVLDLQKHPVAHIVPGADAPAGVAAYVEVRADIGAPLHGVGVATDEETASILAALSALNRLAESAARPRAAAVL